MPEVDVIGAGPTGEVLAGRTAAAGLSTAILEERRSRDLAGALRTAFDHDGSALVEVMVARHELSLPPTITLEQVKASACTRRGPCSPGGATSSSIS
jgi:hypothetical protein